MSTWQSKHSRRGLMYEAYKKFFGQPDPTNLVWQAGTKIMNPTIDADFLAEEFEADPAAAEAEYNANFRTDVESYVSREVIDAAVVTGRLELPPIPKAHYFGFVDPSGGSADSMTLAICHRDGERIIVDAVRERKPPFSPEDCVLEFAGLLKGYRISHVTGDRYAGEWPRERFQRSGIRYEVSEPSPALLTPSNLLANAECCSDDKEFYSAQGLAEHTFVRGQCVRR